MNRSICKRCHRLHPVNGVRVCAACEQALRAEERRRPALPPPPPAGPAVEPDEVLAFPEIEGGDD